MALQTITVCTPGNLSRLCEASSSEVVGKNSLSFSTKPRQIPKVLGQHASRSIPTLQGISRRPHQPLAKGSAV